MNSLQSDQSTSAANDVRYASESPVQVIKVEGSNRLCSRGAASPDVILVSIAAVAKRASRMPRAAPSIRRVVKKTETMNFKVIGIRYEFGDRGVFTILGIRR